MQYLPKEVVFGDEARERVLKGASILARAVGSTMGQKGRKALSEQEFGVEASLDGVWVTRQIDLEDRVEEMGLELVRGAAKDTNQKAGDGTTATTILAHALMENGQKLLAEGKNAVALTRGVTIAMSKVLSRLKDMAITTESEDDLRSVAFISSRDESIASTVASVLKKIGKEGVVTVERAAVKDMEVEYTDGMQFESGYMSYYFINDRDRMMSVIEDTFVLIYDGKIRDVKDILPIYQKIAADTATANHLVIIADEVPINSAALATIFANNKQGLFETVVVNAPEYGERRKEFMRDLAILTGGEMCSPDTGKHIKDLTLADLGRARRVEANKYRTTIIDGAGPKGDIEARIKELQTLRDDNRSQFEQDKLQERIARLTNGIVVVKVGAQTEIALKEKLDRVDDALGSAKSALEEGIVAGGGVALIEAGLRAYGVKNAKGMYVLSEQIASPSTDEEYGEKLLVDCLEVCAKQIAENAGYSGEDTVIYIKGSDEKDLTNNGLNVATGEYCDMIRSHIIDPAKVVRLSLENAVSVASMFLTMETAIAWNPKALSSAK